MFMNSAKDLREVAEYTNGQGVDITKECAGSKITEAAIPTYNYRDVGK